MDEGRDWIDLWKVGGKENGNVMDLPFARMQARRPVIFAMKPTSSANIVSLTCFCDHYLRIQRHHLRFPCVLAEG